MEDEQFEAMFSRLSEIVGSRSARGLAHALEISEQAVYKSLRARKIPNSWVYSIARKFKVPADWIMLGTLPEHGLPLAAGTEASVRESQPAASQGCRRRVVPLLGLAACGLAGWYNPSPLAVTVPLPFDSPQDSLFAVIAVGNSMQPDGIRQGYVLFCDQSFVPEKGDAVFIELYNGTVSIKQYVREDEDWLYIQGWLDPDEKGEQKPYSEKLAKSMIKRLACVVMVRRKA